MRLGIAQNTARASITRLPGPLPRLLLMLLAAAMSLLLLATVLAQRPAPIGAAVLMKRLGCTRYVAQGGDRGSVAAYKVATLRPQGLLGIRIDMPTTMPPEVAKVLASGGPSPSGLWPVERVAFDGMDALYEKGFSEGLHKAFRSLR